MTYARSRPNTIVPYAEKNNIGLMTNAAHRWSKHTSGFNDLWDYNTNHVVDSGGYNVQSKFRGYPWTVNEYHEWLKSQSDKFKWAACMDLACEKRFDEIHSVGNRMDKTLNNTIKHFDLNPDYKLLPVLQGRTIRQWIRSYENLKDHGIPLDYVGLGTVCRLSSQKRVVDIEKTIRSQCKRIKQIHGFGIKVNAFKHGATFDSADSQAWVIAPSNGFAYYDGGDRLEKVDMPNDSKTRTVESFKNYYKYVNRLMD